jgi:hypothetical protein
LFSAARSLLIVCLLAAACTAASLPATGAKEQALEIHSRALPLRLDEPGATSVGRLLWRGGLSIKANSRSFGGWSDLHVTPDGRTLTSISDQGAWFTATIDYDGQGNLAGLSDGHIGKLRGLDGQPLIAKAQADAEGMARLPDGSWLVSFERQHRLWRYPTLSATPRSTACGPAPWSAGSASPPQAAATRGRPSNTCKPRISIRRRSPGCPTDRLPRSSAPSISSAACVAA